MDYFRSRRLPRHISAPFILRALLLLTIFFVPQTALGQSEQIKEFCDAALTVDRGAALFTMRSTCELIREFLINNPDFQAVLELSDAQVEQIKHRKYVEGVDDFAIDDEHQIRMLDTVASSTCHADLQHFLTEEQHQKLPLVYLQLEGLMALRRPEFCELVGMAAEQQKTLAAHANSKLDSDACDHYRALFAIGDPNHVHQQALRRVAVALDHDIAAMLDDEQQRRLAHVIARSSTLPNRTKWTERFSSHRPNSDNAEQK